MGGKEPIASGSCARNQHADGSRPNLTKATSPENLNVGGRRMSTICSQYVGRRDLLRELGVSKVTLLRWTETRGFPKPMPNGGQIPIYDRAEIDAWLRSEEPNNV